MEKNFEGWPAYKIIKHISKGMCQCQNCQNIRQFTQGVESGVNTYATEQEMIIALVEKYLDQFQPVEVILIDLDITDSTVQREDLRQLFGNDQTNTDDDGDKKN
ncbi:MAG TPA: hypothetical protein VJB35_06600 [Candidatus Nanoarchaeia archaeon]|nr:hypothetical protein [Candidatus Nanoarchaeia archaeon]